MNHYKAIDVAGLLAIYKGHGSPWMPSEPDERFRRELGITGCWWDRISKAEFETYQAFGIREIKL